MKFLLAAILLVAGVTKVSAQTAGDSTMAIESFYANGIHYTFVFAYLANEDSIKTRYVRQRDIKGKKITDSVDVPYAVHYYNHATVYLQQEINGVMTPITKKFIAPYVLNDVDYAYLRLKLFHILKNLN